MIKKTVTFENVDGAEETQELMFHLSKSDFIHMFREGLEKKLEEWMNVPDPKKLAPEDFKDEMVKYEKNLMDALDYLVRNSYGERVTDADGSHPRFVKDKEKTEEFLRSDAYGEFFVSLFQDPDAFANFIMALIPKGLQVEDDEEALKALTPEQRRYLESISNKNK